MQQLGPLLAPDGYVLSLQNGMNEKVIARHVGAARTVGAFVHFGADLMEPGLSNSARSRRSSSANWTARVTPRAEALRDMLSHVMPAEVTTNIWGFLWGKLVYGAMAFACSTVDASVPQVMDDPLGRRICYEASSEAYRVAKSQADRLEMIGEFDPNLFAPGDDAMARGESALMEMANAMRASVKQHMGIWRDLAVKKRKTEVDMQTAVIVETGRAAGHPHPRQRRRPRRHPRDRGRQTRHGVEQSRGDRHAGRSARRRIVRPIDWP